MTIMCTTEFCPLRDECYRKLCVMDPIDQQYKDFKGKEKSCKSFIKIESNLVNKKGYLK